MTKHDGSACLRVVVVVVFSVLISIYL
jgi:hypothetical protein